MKYIFRLWQVWVIGAAYVCVSLADSPPIYSVTDNRTRITASDVDGPIEGDRLNEVVWSLNEHPRIASVAPRIVGVKPENIHDGDTLTKVSIELPFGVTLRDQSIRAAKYDAWEITRARQTVGEITEEHLEKGRQAKKALEALLVNRDVFLIPQAKSKDPYGRILAELYVVENGSLVSVAERMNAGGHCRK